MTPATFSLVAARWWEPEWFNDHLPGVGGWIKDVVDWMTLNLGWLWGAVEWPVNRVLDPLIGGLVSLPWPLAALLFVAIGWAARDWIVGVLSGIGLVVVGFLGPDLWLDSMETIAMIVTAVVFSVVIGMPLGIWSARNDHVEATIRPVLDAFQTIHPFVYLLPAIFFFGIGNAPGVIVTVIFAMPPMVRLTNLGIRQVPEDVVEAARAFGTPDLQLLREVQLPLAKDTILAGLNQTLMLSLSMVVIAALIAADGLGAPILRGVQSNNIAVAGTSGIAVLVVAVILDRISQPGREPSDT